MATRRALHLHGRDHAAAIPPDPASPAYFGAGVELFVDDDGVFASSPGYDSPGTMQMIVVSPPYPAADASVDTCPGRLGRRVGRFNR